MSVVCSTEGPYSGVFFFLRKYVRTLSGHRKLSVIERCPYERCPYERCP